ncbi:UNVERIFIED_CONTAM: hypothetical protein PYX00_009639 [Menopon gallinae]|uniref:Protein croquemort n=1 Tax=Menopon gallinae TaxID=328185 RepID=A0AAW2HC47_9NEOP
MMCQGNYVSVVSARTVVAATTALGYSLSQSSSVLARRRMIGCQTKCQITSILIGILLMVFGCLLQVYWETLLRGELKRKFILSPTSKTYDSWEKTKVPVYCKFYFFNWTNPSDISHPDYKPVFDEVGPYVFLQTLEKVDIAFHDNGTVSYKLKRYWYFDRERSVGPLSDRITSANPVAAAVKFSQIFFSDMREIPYDRFGWWYPRNGSVSEVYNMQTGENGMNTFGELTAWNYKSNAGFYNGSCGEVFGSGGNFWPWDIRKSDTIFIFSGDICRSISMSFTEELSYQGLRAYKYESGPEFVDNGTLVSSNECLCNGECTPVGVFNASSCSKDAPVFISYPHFQYADPYFSDAVVGMKPEKDKHNIYLILDPKYGVPLEFSARIQINLLVETNKKNSDWRDTSKKRVFFPVLWVDQNFEIKRDDLETMKMIMYLPAIGFIVSVMAIITGTFIILGCLVCRLFHKNKKVPLCDNSTRRTADSKIAEPDKSHIKFSYIKDSNF